MAMNRQRRTSNISNIFSYDDAGNIVIKDYSQVIRYSWNGTIHGFIGPVSVSSVAAATTDTDKFLVSDGGVLKFRTGAEVLSDIGGQPLLTNPVTGTGVAGQVAYWSGTNSQTGSNNLFWDAANNRLGIGTNTPAVTLDVRNGVNLYTSGASANSHYLELISTTSTDGYVNFRRSGGANGPAAYYISGGIARFSYNAATGDTILGAYANSPLLFFTNSSERARFTAAGRLLLGTSTEASFLLDVNGTARVTDAVTFGSDINLTRASSPAIVSTTNQSIRFSTNGFTGTFDTSGRFTSTIGFRTDGFVQTVNLAVGASYYNTAAPTNGAIIQGNVGIGTTSPAYKMHLFNSGSVTSAIEASGAGADSILRFISPSQYWTITNDGTSAHLTFNRGGTDLIRFSNVGNLLVGTTADQGYRVQITGSGDNMLNVWGATTPSIRLDNAASGATQRFVIGLATATNNFIQGANAGDVCLTTASASAMVFGMWQTSSSSEVMRISTSSNVLIGKNTDSGQKLQVVGKVNLTSLPTSATGLVAGDIWNNGGVLNIV